MLTQHLEKLGHFLGIVRAGSIRSYAITHNLSQPAISKCMQILEAELETALIIRSRGGIALTQSGEELFEWADRMLSEAKSLQQSIKARGNLMLEGKLIMGAYPSIAVYFAPRLYKFLQREQRNLKIHFASAPSSELIWMLRSGEVDFAISIDPPGGGEFFQMPLIEDTYSLYRNVSCDRKVTEAPLFTLPSARDRAGRTLTAYLKSAKLWNQTVVCGDFEAAKAMVEADAGYAVLPGKVALPLLEAKRIEKAKDVRGLSDFGKHSVVFSCKAHRSSDASILWLANQIRLMLGKEA